MSIIILSILFGVGFVFLFHFIGMPAWSLVLFFLLGMIFCIVLLLLLVVIITNLFKYTKKTKDNQIVERYMPYKIYQFIIIRFCSFIKYLLRVKIKVKNDDIFPKGEKYLLVSNHQSLLDPVFYFAHTKDKSLFFLMKQEIKKIIIVGKLLRSSGYLYLNRENNREGLKVILKAIEEMKKGRNCGVYIEGTRSKDGNILPFHDASLKMAYKTNAKIVVMIIDNSNKVFKSFPFKSTNVLIKFCKVYNYEDYCNLSTKDLSTEIRNLMIEELEKERNK